MTLENDYDLEVAMGARGPAPTPSRLTALTGARNRVPGKREHHPAGTIGKPPKELFNSEAKVWGELAKSMGPAFTAADRTTLDRYCRLVIKERELWAAIRDGGDLIIDAEGSTRRNPLWMIWKSLSTELTALSAQLALTPAARARLGATLTEPETCIEKEYLRLLGAG